MPKQVWKTEDGSIFDTIEDAIKHEKERKITSELISHLKEFFSDSSAYDIADYIIAYWGQIKSIMEGDK